MAITGFTNSINAITNGGVNSTFVENQPRGKSHAEAMRRTGAELRANMTAEDKNIEGSKRDKVQFITSLGDPTRLQARQEKNKDVKSYKVVGYKFQALEDMTIYKAPYKEDFQSFVDVVDEVEEREIKSGEIFVLNLVETAMLISRLEYSGIFCGGDGPEVHLSVKFSSDRSEPLPILTFKKNEGSIKAHMEMIADMVGANESTGYRGEPVIKEEFKDDFHMLYNKYTSGRKASSTRMTAGSASENLSAAFRDAYSKKFKNINN